MALRTDLNSAPVKPRDTLRVKLPVLEVFSRARMTDSAQRQPRYRFGLFEVFPDSGELWKHGHRIRFRSSRFGCFWRFSKGLANWFPARPFETGCGPELHFVEFDQSLRTTVTKLRQALGDEADNPRFIETVPKRGFRLAPVSVVASAASPEPAVSSLATSDKSAGTDAVTSLATAVRAASASARSTNRRWLYAAAAAVVVLAIASPFVFRRLFIRSQNFTRTTP